LTHPAIVAFAPAVTTRFQQASPPRRHVRLALAFALALGGPAGALFAADAKPDALVRFTKTKLFFLDASPKSPNDTGLDRYVEFERKRILYGAITPSDQRERYGNYFTFMWESRRPADVIVRLEYRQQALGPVVQTKEIPVRAASGHLITRFQVTGDDYLQYGRVLAWRATILEGGRVVAETRSYLWR
jgi:hypothetical protein